MGRPKQFIELLGMPALHYTLQAFEESPEVARIYAVGDGHRIEDLVQAAGISKYAACAEPGEARSLSTRNGLLLCAGRPGDHRAGARRVSLPGHARPHRARRKGGCMELASLTASSPGSRSPTPSRSPGKAPSPRPSTGRTCGRSRRPRRSASACCAASTTRPKSSSAPRPMTPPWSSGMEVVSRSSPGRRPTSS